MKNFFGVPDNPDMSVNLLLQGHQWMTAAHSVLHETILLQNQDGAMDFPDDVYVACGEHSAVGSVLT